MRRTTLLLFPIFAVLLAFKLSFYFSLTPVTGWDTVGHLHLARQYRSMLVDFASLGYDTAWFQGFPVFYFYPPFFYFLIAHVDLVLGTFRLPFVASFNFGLLCTLLLFCFAYIRLAALLLAHVEPVRRMMLIALGLLIYLSFPGRGLQGTGLVGFLGGTVVATLGHTLVLTAFYYLERWRTAESDRWSPERMRFLCAYCASAGLIFYTHYLSAVFFFLLLLLYIALFRRELFSPRWMLAIPGVPVLLAWAPALTYLSFRDYFSGTASLPDYPALISIIGSDFLDRMLAEPGFLMPFLKELLVEFKWVNILLAVIFARYISRGFRFGIPGLPVRFLLLAALLLLWISQDESLAYLLYPFGIHWYRVFDLFFSFFTINLLFAIEDEQSGWIDSFRANLVLGALTAILLLRFVLWDPAAHERYASMHMQSYGNDAAGLEAFLETIPADSLILPEKLRNRDFQGSPHALDYYIDQHGHRNALGLTVESSLTAMLQYAYLHRGMGHIFSWGVDLTWQESLYQNLSPGETLPAYLRRAGVSYVIGRTRRLLEYLGEREEFFEPVYRDKEVYAFRVRDARPLLGFHDTAPLGFLSYQRIRGERIPGRPRRDFLLEANRVRLRLGEGPPIVNLDPVYAPLEHETFQRDLSGLIIVNRKHSLAPSHEVHRFARPDRQLILVNFEKTAPDPGPTRYLYTVLNVPGAGTRPTPASVRPVRDADPHPERIAVAPPARTDDGTNDGLAPGNACQPLEIKFSFFPHWRAANDATIFQTENNHMLVCTRGQPTRLTFASPLSRPLTVMMYLLALVLLGNRLIPLAARFRRPRTNR